MVSFNLKRGHHHIEIFKDHQVYTGFSWTSTDSMQTRFDTFTVLPFGVSAAPLIFTTTFKPLEKRWRHQGICVALLLDDGRGIDKDQQVCCAIARELGLILEGRDLSRTMKISLGTLSEANWLGIT